MKEGCSITDYIIIEKDNETYSPAFDSPTIYYRLTKWINGIWFPDPYPRLTVADNYLKFKGKYYNDLTQQDEYQETNLSVTLSTDNEYAPLLIADQGFIVQKDIQAGGILGSGQGVLFLGHGLVWQCDRPKITLSDSAHQILKNDDETDIASGQGQFPQTPAPEKGQIFIRTDQVGVNPPYTLYKFNGTTWDSMGLTSSYSGNFDTLFLTKAGGVDPAHLDLCNLTVHGNFFVDGLLRFNNDAKLSWVNTSTLAIQNSAGTTADGALDVGSIFINNLQPLNSGSPAGVNINCPLNIGGSRGTTGQLLTSNGSSSSPTWTTPTSWNGGTITENITLNSANPTLKFQRSTSATNASGWLDFYTNTGTRQWLAGMDITGNNGDFELVSYNSKKLAVYAPITSSSNISAGLNLKTNYSNLDWGANQLHFCIGGAAYWQMGITGGTHYGQALGDYFIYNTNRDTMPLTIQRSDDRIKIATSLFGASGTLNLSSDTEVAHDGTVYLNVDSSNGGAATLNIQCANSTKLAVGYDCSNTYFTASEAGNMNFVNNNGSINFTASTGKLYTISGLQICPNSGGTGQIGNTSEYYSAMVANQFYGNGGGNGSESGSVGVSSHRFSSCYIRTVYTLGGGQYDVYDDLAIAKLWGETNPQWPSDYDPAKVKPEGAPFDFLKLKNEDGTVDEYFNLNKLTSFTMGCIKALAKNDDEHDEQFEALLSEVEDLKLQMQQLKQSIAD